MKRQAAEPLYRSQLVPRLFAYLRQRGLDPKPLADRYRITPEAERERDVVLPLEAFYALQDDAERLAGDPFLGVHLASAYERGAYGVADLAARAAPNAREALRRVARFFALQNDLVVVSFEERDGMGIIEERIPGRPACVGRHANEFFVVSLLEQGRAAVGVRVIPRRVWLAHPAPPDTGELHAVVGTDALVFDAGKNAIGFDAAALDFPMHTADPPVLSVLDQFGAGALARNPRPTSVAEQVRGALSAGLAGAQPTLEAIAERLQLSARTLQRRLAGENARFAKIVDDVRAAAAREAVREGRLTLSEIAWALGYAELSPFLRAFRRWTGGTPRQYRKRG